MLGLAVLPDDDIASFHSLGQHFRSDEIISSENWLSILTGSNIFLMRTTPFVSYLQLPLATHWDNLLVNVAYVEVSDPKETIERKMAHNIKTDFIFLQKQIPLGVREGLCLAPRVGFEPTTLRLTAECSAAELSRNINL